MIFDSYITFTIYMFNIIFYILLNYFNISNKNKFSYTLFFYSIFNLYFNFFKRCYIYKLTSIINVINKVLNFIITLINLLLLLLLQTKELITINSLNLNIYFQLYLLHNLYKERKHIANILKDKYLTF